MRRATFTPSWIRNSGLRRTITVVAHIGPLPLEKLVPVARSS
jgi:hypothetical protein